MTLSEIKEALALGSVVCWNNSGYIVTLQKVCPLHDLSVIFKRTGYVTALAPSEYEDCFIV
jgi:hypothetical protein